MKCHCRPTLSFGLPPYCPFDCGVDNSFSVGRAYPSSSEFVPDVLAHSQQIPMLPPLRLPNESPRKGWICPKCDNAVSPDEKTCPYCKPKPKKESDNGEHIHINETD